MQTDYRSFLAKLGVTTTESAHHRRSRPHRTAGLTSAVLILFLAFAALASGPETDIKIFATGLGAGILLDATVVRMLLVPALMSMLGPWNWWLPSWAGRGNRANRSESVSIMAGCPRR